MPVVKPLVGVGSFADSGAISRCGEEDNLGVREGGL